MAQALPATQFTTASTPSTACAMAAGSVVSSLTFSTSGVECLADALTGVAHRLEASIAHSRDPM
jgi:hypothetical protein